MNDNTETANTEGTRINTTTTILLAATNHKIQMKTTSVTSIYLETREKNKSTTLLLWHIYY